MEPGSSKRPSSLTAGSEQLCSVLRSGRFFGDFPENEITLPAECAETQVMDNGTFVFRGGDRGGFMGLLIEGGAELFKRDRTFGGQRIARISAGMIVGEMALVGGQSRSATCICTNQSTWAMLTRENFVRIIRESPPLSVNILRKIGMLLSRRLRQTSGDLVDSLEGRETGRDTR